ncbi:hypothetical protein HYW83_05420 [Candidatus Peregrinibacteria bacterium]|nr:hypothetical protein [Candidatus Peregrinibacteria bacterium]
MFNFLSKIWRKNRQIPSYEESEKLLISSLLPPMKPTDQFKAVLKEQLLNRFPEAKSAVKSFFGRKFIFSGAAALLILLAVGSTVYFLPKSFGPPQVPIVRASSQYVAVNFPIRVAFPYDIAAETVQKYFSIKPSHSEAKQITRPQGATAWPEIEGTVSVENGVLTFSHPKNLEYETEYTLKVSKEASSKMEQDFTISFTTRARLVSEFYLASRIDMAHSTVNFYDLKPKVFINMPYDGNYTARIYKTSADGLLDYIAATEKNASQGKMNDDNTFKALKKNLLEEQKVVVKPNFVYEPGIQEAGMYFVEMTGKPKTEYDEGVYRFFITDSRYALSTKRLGTKLVTWMVDMQTGAGIPDAKVTGYSLDRTVVFEGKTNANGIHEQEVGLDFEKQPSALVFDTGSERVVNMVRVKYRSIFDVDWSNRQQPYQGYVMFDRPLYKPGDTVQFKTLLRKTGETNYDGSIKTAHIEVRRSNYGEASDTLFKNDYSVSRTGTFAGDFPLNKELKTGEYSLTVKVGDKEIISEWFGVEVFQKPDFEVAVKPDQEAYVSGDTVKVDVSANYFFGAAVKNQKVTVSIEDTYYYRGSVATKDGVLDSSGHFKAVFEDFRSSKENDSYWGYGAEGQPFTIRATVNEDTGKTFSKSSSIYLYPSQYTLKIEEPQALWNLKPREKIPFTFRVARALDKSEMNGVAGAKIKLDLVDRSWDRTLMSLNEKHLLPTDTTITTDSFGKAKFEFEFPVGGSYQLIASSPDPKGNTAEFKEYFWIPDAENNIFYDASLPQATAQIALVPDKESYKAGETAKVKVYTPQEEGDMFVSVNTKSMRRMFVQKLSGSDHELEISVTEDLAPGFFIFAEVYNSDTFFTGTRFIEVTGKKLSVEIMPSQKQLYPKDEVTLSVITKDENGNPVSSEGALTVVDKALLALRAANDKTLFDSFYVRPSEYNMSRFTTTDPFSVGAAEKGGCFLPGTLILMADGSQKPIEEIRVGDVILTKADDFSSQLVKDTVVRTFEHTVGEYLVINGSLKVTPIHRMFANGGWKTAGEVRLGDWFLDYRGRQVFVTSLEKTYNRVKVYNFETERLHTYFADGIYVHNDKGGDSRPRTEFLDTAYWNAFVETGSDGKGSVTFKVPDNLTTWVALGKNITTDTKVGEGENEFIVTKDLFIRPNLPLFVRSGDEMEIEAPVHNTTNRDLAVKALIKATGATVLNETLQEISVSANSSKSVRWKVRVDEVKELKFEFSVNEVGGKLVDNLVQKVAVYPSTSLDNTVLTGAAPKKLDFVFDADSPYSNATLTLAASAVGILPEIIEKLTGFPYGCVEQTMSKHLPNVLVKKYSELLGVSLPSDLDKSLEEGFERLRKYQHNDGSFGWWENDNASIWMTGYVLEGFLEIKDMGLLAGRESMYQRTLEYLKNALPNLKADERIYANYVLARALPKDFLLEIDEEELRSLQPEFLGYVALAHHYNGNKEEAQRIVKDYILKKLEDSHWEQPDNLYDGHDLSMGDKYLATGVNLSALLTIGGAQESEIREIVQWLMTHRNGYEGLWGSTRQSSQVLFALLKFIQKYNEFDPNFDYAITLGNEKLFDGKANGKNFSKKIEIPSKKLSAKNALEISSSGKGTLYYTLSVKNYTGAASASDEIKVSRSYMKDGKAVKEFSVGDVLEVRLDVESPKDLTYVMVEDMLPAGFDVINDRLQRDNQYGYDYYEGGYYWSDEVDIRDEHVALFSSYVSAGRRAFSYRVRVSRKGTYSAPAPKVTPMYDPQLMGVGTKETLAIR